MDNRCKVVSVCMSEKNVDWLEDESRIFQLSIDSIIEHFIENAREQRAGVSVAGAKYERDKASPVVYPELDKTCRQIATGDFADCTCPKPEGLNPSGPRFL